MALGNTVSTLNEQMTEFCALANVAATNASAARRARKLSTSIAATMKQFRAESVRFHNTVKGRKAEITARIMAELASEEEADKVTE